LKRRERELGENAWDAVKKEEGSRNHELMKQGGRKGNQ